MKSFRDIQRFKSGAASFYIVAFSTLILVILAMSFATLIISEMTRTSNSDLSQSAYDSAMAGVEDAKLAIANYNNCRSGGTGKSYGGITCEDIIAAVESDNCNTVGYIVGRYGNVPWNSVKGNSEEAVIIKEAQGSENNMSQAYTCVKLKTTLENYEGTLNSTNPVRVIRAKFADNYINDIEKIKISWSKVNEDTPQYTNYDGFPQINTESDIALPPTISLTMIQTSEKFSISDFELSVGDKTDLGMLYLVPTKSGGENSIDAGAFVKSNDKTSKNIPKAIYCPEDNDDSGYRCSAMIDIPLPIGTGYGENDQHRSSDTFTFIVALPYSRPATEFKLEFFCRDGASCYSTSSDDNGVPVVNQVNLEGVQIEIDSTGRANDIYRRVQARVEGTDNYSLAVMGPLELLGENKDGDDNALLKKKMKVLCEYNFPSGIECDAPLDEETGEDGGEYEETNEDDEIDEDIMEE